MMASRAHTYATATALFGMLRAAQAQLQCDYLGSDIEATSADVGWDR